MAWSFLMAWQFALIISQSINAGVQAEQSPTTNDRDLLLLIAQTVQLGHPGLLQDKSTSLHNHEHHVASLPALSASGPQLCLGLGDVFIALFLIILILMTIFGNILVVLSVFLYKRMRTFTNILLTSLATADLLVGLVVMPLALVDLLFDHNWQFGRFLCSVWATTDVLLCTASILNLCVISLDRYMAITSPLKYPRTRSRLMAILLLSSVWFISLVVCSPPWIIPSWGIFNQQTINYSNKFVCGYPVSIPYRIYSALCSFYIPLLIMLSVYFKIFRVASEREKLMRQNLGTCRLSRRIDKHRRRQQLLQANNHNSDVEKKRPTTLPTVIDLGEETDSQSPTCQRTLETTPNNNNNTQNRESKSLLNLNENTRTPPKRKNTEVALLENNCHQTSLNNNNNNSSNDLQPSNLVAKAQKHYNTHGPGKAIRGSKEKIVYLRERKALKTIGIVVLGFIICWMPFFVIYLAEVFIQRVHTTYSFKILSEFFLWLGYSNSVLNPIIYTMYNGDFRRCFRDLLGFGCVQTHRRTMSVKKLHQQSTVF
ncbi:unnamed protein product [Bursaphelenchus okinawaensis]|uniref:G-protein coupled receptors family 1 profile domain-containing protein n=1 Tax=Bursaphelenchus okinawaensis TaxID=465554 RepID=A0A811KI77_9BILA|nr:unnamed protein product [Bursaphelenchus okinawaensis]CAG9103337.1 unnamed protein product [Bursaphelenchus okinawaensis]